jgi:putative aldouronate transport system permease protein
VNFISERLSFNAGLIPHYLVLRAYGLRNNFLVYVLPTMLSAYYIILIKTFIEQLPQSLEESAMIDGAGYFTIFSKIILPLSKPILATIAVFAAVAQWNNFFDALLYVSDSKIQPMQLLLYNFLQQSQSVAASLQDSSGGAVNPLDALTPDSVRMTITMVVTLPIVFVYPFMQKYFVGGIMMGAVKG